jgi:DNA-binding SARP family transcriptional activator
VGIIAGEHSQIVTKTITIYGETTCFHCIPRPFLLYSLRQKKGDAMAPHLRLYLLGPPRIERDRVPIAMDTHKATALLAYLAVTGGLQRRDTLVDLLWPDSDPSDGRNALRRTLSVLRTALARQWLQTGREGVSLSSDSDAWSDVGQISACLSQRASHGHPSTSVCPACLPPLTDAASLYRGDFMSGFGLRDAPDFDDWQVQQAEELDCELSRILERLVRAYIAQGDLESAIAYGRRWLALDRLNEAAHGQLMRLHAWSGRRPAALQQYQECVRILQEELGVSPQDSLTALHDAIRTGGAPLPPASALGRDNAETLDRPLPAPLLPAAPAVPLPAVTILEEKRIVTVLFVDVSETLPTAGEREAVLVQQFVSQAEDIVHRYGGHVVRWVGGSKLVVFGAALSRESDPELAIRTALAMRDEAKKLGLSLAAGISTGEVYAARSDAASGQPSGLVGRTIDLALRLATQAQPGRILVQEPTYRASRGAFGFARLELTAGATQPATVYQVDGLLAQPLKARGMDGMRAELTGRDDEIAHLKAALDHACCGEGQMVSIIGDAGVGKSRLVAELKAYALAKAQPPLWLEGRCLDMDVPLSYAPFLDILHGYVAWTAQDDEVRRRQSVASCLQQLVEQGHLGAQRADEVGALLCRLLSLPAGDGWADRLGKESPEQIRNLTFLAVRDFFHALARQQPVVLVFEDLHWSDSVSLDLIALLMEGLGEQALLLLCVYRPEREQAVRRLAAVADQKCRDSYTELLLRGLTR